MPISSSEISQLNGAFMQQSMAQQQYGQQIGSGAYGGFSGTYGDRNMSGVMNKMGSIGAPMAAVGMGLLGLDPLSMGLKAGMGAYGAGAGFGGAMAAGAVAAAPMMAAGALVHHGASQMWLGAQQQETFNNVLRQTFNFRNQYGGQGFDRNQMSQMGSQVREMTHSFGPGGEVASFGELTQLAGKMGQMGFSQGVREVKEFTTKFKEMVKSLKTMATDLGTTLEGAMEFASAAKQSGMFGMNRIQGFTSAARAASVSGGVAMSEVTSAANMGSQIVRSVGGLGRQGAMAGVRTISQIGTAQQMGVLSEEDIYNVTGLTGAEGRQAYAATSMADTAKWLKGGRGRRFLASMADKDGNIDPQAMNQFVNGGMSISETMRNDSTHLSKVGRANFIRNEGRLRGEAMAKMGAFMPALQLQEWAASKGVNINEMDDRSMVFAQRQLGWDREKVDTAIKMANNLPAIMEEERRSKENDSTSQNLALSRQNRGTEGMKRRFAQARETVNGKLQAIGQDFFNSGADQIDEFVNRLTGIYVDTYSKDVDDQYRSFRAGGNNGKAMFSKGGGSSTFARTMGQRNGAYSVGGGAGASSMMDQFNAGSDMNLHDALTGKGSIDTPWALTAASPFGAMYFGGKYAMNLGQNLIQGQSGRSRMTEAGFDMSGARDDASLHARLRQIDSLRGVADQAAARVGGDRPTDASWIKQAYAIGSIEGGGDKGTESFGAAVMKSGSDRQKAEWAAAQTPEEKVAVMSKLKTEGGIDAGHTGRQYSVPGGVNAWESGRFHSQKEQNLALANVLGINVEHGAGEIAAAGAIETAAGISTMGLSTLFSMGSKALGGKGLGESAAGSLFGSDKLANSAGEYLKSTAGRDMVRGILSADPRARAAATDRLQGELIKAREDPSANGDEIAYKTKMLAAADLNSLWARSPGGQISASAREQFEKDHPGVSMNDAARMVGGLDKMDEGQRRRDVARAALGARGRADTDVGQLTGLGIYDADKKSLTEGALTDFKKMGEHSANAAALVIGQLNAEQGLAGSEYTTDADRELMDQSARSGRYLGTEAAAMTTKEQRAFASKMGGQAGAFFNEHANIEEKLGRGWKKGKAGAAASVLGVTSFSKEALGKMDLKDEKSVRAMLLAAGLKPEDINTDDVKGIASAAGASTNQKGSLATALQNVTGSTAFRNIEKDKRLKSQEDSDPLQASIKKNGEETNKLLADLVKYSGMTAAEVKNLKDKENPETFGPPKPPGT